MRCPICPCESALRPRSHFLTCPFGQSLWRVAETLMATHGWPLKYAAHVVKRRLERSLLPKLALQRDALLKENLMNDVLERGDAGKEEKIGLLRELAHKILQGGFGPEQLAMAAAIQEAPAGTVPLVRLICSLEQAVLSPPLVLACFQPDTPRSEVPRTLQCTAEELLARYDSAACPTRLASRCLAVVQLYKRGELFFDLTAVVWLGGDGPLVAQA